MIEKKRLISDSPVLEALGERVIFNDKGIKVTVYDVLKRVCITTDDDGYKKVVDLILQIFQLGNAIANRIKQMETL